MSQLFNTSIFILLITLLLTGCGPMLCNTEGKCGGMMNMAKKADMKCSSDKKTKDTTK